MHADTSRCEGGTRLAGRQDGTILEPRTEDSFGWHRLYRDEPAMQEEDMQQGGHEACTGNVQSHHFQSGRGTEEENAPRKDGAIAHPPTLGRNKRRGHQPKTDRTLHGECHHHS